MAFGRLERNPGSQPMSDINMTPLIDVMLVLLVIFIITAPLMASSLKLDLPRAEGAASSEAPAFVALAIDAQGRVFLGEQAIQDAAAREAVMARVREAARRDPSTEVQLRADSRVPYGRVAELIGWVQQAGLTRIGFVTETTPTDQHGRGGRTGNPDGSRHDGHYRRPSRVTANWLECGGAAGQLCVDQPWDVGKGTGAGGAGAIQNPVARKPPARN